MIFKIIFGFHLLCMWQFSKNFATSLAENDIAEANNTRKAKICKSNSVFHNIISTIDALLIKGNWVPIYFQ